jgi:hypothetical protein
LIGKFNAYLSNYPEALKCYSAMLKISEEAKDKKNIAGSNYNIGAIYFFQGD